MIDSAVVGLVLVAGSCWVPLIWKTYLFGRTPQSEWIGGQAFARVRDESIVLRLGSSRKDVPILLITCLSPVFLTHFHYFLSTQPKSQTWWITLYATRDVFCFCSPTHQSRLLQFTTHSLTLWETFHFHLDFPLFCDKQGMNKEQRLNAESICPLAANHEVTPSRRWFLLPRLLCVVPPHHANWDGGHGLQDDWGEEVCLPIPGWGQILLYVHMGLGIQ